MASQKSVTTRKDFVHKTSKAFTGKGTAVIKDTIKGDVIIGELQKKGGKRVPSGQRNISFFPPRLVEREEYNLDDNSIVTISKELRGAKLAADILSLIAPLSLAERNEVIEPILIHLRLLSIEETSKKKEIYHESERGMEQFHNLISGDLMNKKADKPVPLSR